MPEATNPREMDPIPSGCGRRDSSCKRADTKSSRASVAVGAMQPHCSRFRYTFNQL
jgi:hypothetical protein